MKISTRFPLYNSISFFIVFVFFMCVHESFAQTISATDGGSSCGDCAPPGWSDNGGTPDISNNTTAAANTTRGGGSRWVFSPFSTANITLPLPPNGHTDWLSLRDLGSGGIEESVSTTITGLTAGSYYEVTVYSLTAVTDDSGTNNVRYAGTYNDQFSFEAGGDVRTVPLNSLPNTWGTSKLRFLAGATAEQLIVRPGANGSFTTNGNQNLVETVQVSVSLNAVNEVPVANDDSATTIINNSQTLNVVNNDTDSDGINAATVDLDPTVPGIQTSLTTAEGNWSVDSSGNVTFTPVTDFIGTATIPYTVEDNYILDGNASPSTSEPANITVRVLPDTDNDGVDDETDLDDDNDGILDANEEHCDQPSVANSTSGSGAFQDQLYFFNWTGADFVDGIQNGDSQTFNLPDGLTVTATFSNVINGGSYRPHDMETWPGAYIHRLYNTDGNSEALYGGENQDLSLTVTFTAVKKGVSFPLNLMAIDPESTNNNDESFQATTNGEDWSVLETINSGGVWTGVGTKTIQTNDTEQSGGNTLFYSRDATTLDVVIDAGGLQAFAFGLYLICDTDNDGIPNHRDTDSDNDGCPDALEGDDTSLTLSDLDSENRLNSGVDPNTGVPTVVGNSGQSSVSSTDPLTTSNQCDDDGDGVSNGEDKCEGFDDALDKDNDTVPDGCDDDDDNDGILDEKEGACTDGQSGTWTQVSSTEVSYDFGNGIVAHINHSTADRMQNSSVFPNQPFWSRDIGGDTSQNITVREGESFTISFKDNSGLPVIVSNPEVHLDRVGVTSSQFQQSILLELQGGNTWTRTAGTDDFTVTSTTVRDGGAGLPKQAGHGTGSTQDDPSGTAAGSLRVKGEVSSFTIDGSFISGTSSTAGQDTFAIILFSCQPIDTDGDGVPDYQDTDSDDDGCADAIEGDGIIIDGLSTLSGGSPTADSSSENLGTNSDAEGNPLVDGTEVIQDTALAVTDDTDSTACTADLMLTKVVNQATPKVGGTIIYTLVVTNSGPLNATGVQVTDVLPTGITYSSDTPSKGAYSTSSNIWNIGDLDVGDSVNLQITATVNASGVIVNTAEITSSDQDDIDSTPNSGN